MRGARALRCPGPAAPPPPRRHQEGGGRCRPVPAPPPPGGNTRCCGAFPRTRVPPGGAAMGGPPTCPAAPGRCGACVWAWTCAWVRWWRPQGKGAMISEPGRCLRGYFLHPASVYKLVPPQAPASGLRMSARRKDAWTPDRRTAAGSSLGRASLVHQQPRPVTAPIEAGRTFVRGLSKVGELLAGPLCC